MFKSHTYQPIKIDEAWESISEDYNRVRTEYKQKWEKRLWIMVALFFCFILPGLLYYMIVWMPGKNERQSMALQFVENAFLKIVKDYKYAKVEDAKVKIQPYINYVKIPIGLRTGKRLRVNHSNRYAGQKKCPAEVLISDLEALDLISSYGLIDEIAIDNTRSGLGSTVSLSLLVRNSSKTTLKLNDNDMSIYNLQLAYERVVASTDAKGNVRYSTQIATGFTGVVAEVNAYLPYENHLLVKSKKIRKRAPRSVANVNWKPLKYPLAALPFNQAYDIKTDHEDGPALRKVFQPRHMASMVDFAKVFPPLTISSSPKTGKVVVSVNAISKHDLPFHVESVMNFFKDAEHAKNIIERDITPIIGLMKIYGTLKDKEFFENPRHQFREDLKLKKTK